MSLELGLELEQGLQLRLLLLPPVKKSLLSRYLCLLPHIQSLRIKSRKKQFLSTGQILISLRLNFHITRIFQQLSIQNILIMPTEGVLFFLILLLLMRFFTGVPFLQTKNILQISIILRVQFLFIIQRIKILRAHL